MSSRHYRALVDGYKWTDESGVERTSKVGDTHYLTDEQLAAAPAGTFDFATEEDRTARVADDRVAADKEAAEKAAAAVDQSRDGQGRRVR